MKTYYLKRIRKRFEVIKNENIMYTKYTAVDLKNFDTSQASRDMEVIVTWIFYQYLGVFVYSFWFKRKAKRRAKHNYRLLKNQKSED